MKNLYKLAISITVIASVIGGNIQTTTAQFPGDRTILSQSQNNLIAQSRGDLVQFAVNAIHRLRKEGKININQNGIYKFGDVKVEIFNVQQPNPDSSGFFNPFANWIIVTNVIEDIAVNVQLMGSNSYKSISISHPRSRPGKPIMLPRNTYYPE